MREKRILWTAGVVVWAVGLWGPTAFACYAVVVGKDASSDGAVLLGHNEQNGGQRFLNFRKIQRILHNEREVVRLLGGGQVAQVKETYAFLWSENPGLPYSDSYLNEWGVAIVSDGCRDRGDAAAELESRGQLIKGGISYMLRRLAIERAKTAREGVQVAGDLIGQVGYPAARTYVIADGNEAWLLAVARGKRWVAQRVPDDQVVLLPNVYIIGEVNLSDKAHFLGAPDLIDYAQQRGWYDPAGGKPFRFCEAYAPPTGYLMDPRQWRGQSLVTGREIERSPGRQLPFSVRPARKLSVKDVAAILRYHNSSASICSPSTQQAAVFQLRGYLPPDIGCIYWRTSAEPCTSVLTPWHSGITETPEEYYKPADPGRLLTLEHHFSVPSSDLEPDDKSAWWTFKKLQDHVNRARDRRLRTVREVWDQFEAELFAHQQDVEQKAQELYQKAPSSARAYLTDYSRDTARRSVRKARDLIESFQEQKE